MTDRPPRARRGSVTDETVRHIRRIFRERRAILSDAELAERHGIPVRMVRAIGNRQRYADVTDEPIDSPREK